MIKILFFIEKLEGGGAEKVLCDLVNHMDRTKFDITVQTLWPYDASRYFSPDIRYKTTYNKRNTINQYRFRVEAETGLLYRLHVKDDYDIECAYLEMGPTKVIASSTNKKAKKIAWVHCDLLKAVEDAKSFAEKTSKWYRKYDLIACVSKKVKESFDKIFKKEFRSVVLHNFIDDETIKNKAEESIPDICDFKRPVALAVGTLYPPKNYPRLLNAHKRLIKEGIMHELWILGDGIERPKLEQFVSENRLEQSVRFFGFVQNPYPYMKVSDMVVCSSNYEGYSTAVTEALILGKPVVTTDCSGMRELLGESEFGLVTENDDEAFYLGMKTMLSSESVRDHYVEKATVRGQNITGEKLTKSIESAIIELHEDRRRTNA